MLSFICGATAVFLLFRFFRASLAWVNDHAILAHNPQLVPIYAGHIGGALFFGLLALIFANPQAVNLLFCGVPLAFVGGIIAYFALQRRQKAAVLLHEKQS